MRPGRARGVARINDMASRPSVPQARASRVTGECSSTRTAARVFPGRARDAGEASAKTRERVGVAVRAGARKFGAAACQSDHEPYTPPP